MIISLEMSVRKLVALATHTLRGRPAPCREPGGWVGGWEPAAALVIGFG